MTHTARLAPARPPEPPPASDAAVQRAAEPTGGTALDDPYAMHLIAERGVAGASAPLPYRDELEQSFGRHAGALTGATAQVGGPAGDAAAALGARAYATGDRVAFASSPDRELVGHEAAHLVQQRGGVRLKGGVGEAGDACERQADAVGEAFAAGRPVEPLLDELPGGPAPTAGSAVQRKEDGRKDAERGAGSGDVTETIFHIHKKASQVLELVGHLDKLAEKLTMIGAPLGGKGAQKYLEAARRVQGLAKGVVDVYKGCLDLVGEVSKTVERADKLVKGAGKVLDDVEKVLGGIDLFVKIADQAPLYDFLADPSSEEKARAWARHTGDVFTAAAKVIERIPGLPDFMVKMWTGLLSAPARYIDAFIKILDAYEEKIDAKSGAELRKSHLARVRGVPEGDWDGPLSQVYWRAPTELREYMRQHRRIGGIDLFEDPDGKEQLINAIRADPDPRYEPAVKDRWVRIVEAPDR